MKIDADLMWLGGYKAHFHDIYFGSSEDAVRTADRQAREFKGNQANNIFSVKNPEHGKTYYWRIDGITKKEIVKGNVWQFTIEKE